MLIGAFERKKTCFVSMGARLTVGVFVWQKMEFRTLGDSNSLFQRFFCHEKEIPLPRFSFLTRCREKGRVLSGSCAFVWAALGLGRVFPWIFVYIFCRYARSTPGVWRVVLGERTHRVLVLKELEVCAFFRHRDVCRKVSRKDCVFVGESGYAL